MKTAAKYTGIRTVKYKKRLSYFIIKIKRGYEHLIFRVVKENGMPSFDTDLMSQLTIQCNSSLRTLKLAHTISLTHKKVKI